MNESITRAAGAEHGQEWSLPLMEREIRRVGRVPRQRTTLYADVEPARRERAIAAGPLAPVVQEAAGRGQRSKRWRPESQVVLMAACD